MEQCEGTCEALIKLELESKVEIAILKNQMSYLVQKFDEFVTNLDSREEERRERLSRIEDILQVLKDGQTKTAAYVKVASVFATGVVGIFGGPVLMENFAKLVFPF